MLDHPEPISIDSFAIRVQMRWMGYSVRMDDHCVLDQLMCTILERDHRRKDTVKYTIHHCGIYPREVEAMAVDRICLQALCCEASTSFEDRQCQKLIAKLIPVLPLCYTLCFQTGTAEQPPCPEMNCTIVSSSNPKDYHIYNLAI